MASTTPGRNGDDTVARARRQTPAKPKRAPPLYSASVSERADGAFIPVGSSTADVDTNILTRIQKCFARAEDPAASEQETKAALYQASKWMKRYNVTQAEVLAHESPEERMKHAGQSRVALRRRDGNLQIQVREADYLSLLCYAIECFFLCKFYTESRNIALEVTFYGIAENTVAAVEAFSMVYNLMVEWARPYPGATGKNSYCEGLCNRLLIRAERERDEEKRRATQMDEEEKNARIREEAAEEQARLARLADLPQSNDELTGSQSAVRKDGASPTLCQANGPGSLGSQTGVPDFKNDTATKHDNIADEEDDDRYSEWNGFSDEDEEGGITGQDMHVDFNENETVDYTDFVSGYDDNEADDVDARIDNLAAGMHQNRESSMEPERGTSSNPYSLLSDSEDSVVGDQENGTTRGQQSPTKAAGRDSMEPTAGEDQLADLSAKQLVLASATAYEIADKYMEGQSVKIYKGKNRPAGKRDRQAYDDGARDSKKIDVRRKTIAASVEAGDSP